MLYNAGKTDVAVIGAGHAGIEAALAAARLGLGTTLFTLSLEETTLASVDFRVLPLTLRCLTHLKLTCECGVNC